MKTPYVLPAVLRVPVKCLPAPFVLFIQNMKLRLVVAIVTILLVPIFKTARASDGIALVGSDLNLNLEGQKDWFVYDGGDILGGAYMGWIWEGKSSVSCTVDLKTTIAPGVYNVFVKVFDYASNRGVEDSGRVEVKVDQNVGTASVINRDWNRFGQNRLDCPSIGRRAIWSLTLLKSAT